MKKVININFSGRLINIEEDAYAALQSYMESLKKYFSNEEGQEEIIADIENRIAEIFYDKQLKGATSITTNEVNEVINLIGKPEDFEPQEEPQASTEQHKSSDAKQFVTRGKLYRDGTDKMLGGVCSGIAAYFNIDTVLVRVIFAIALFSGFGFLLYIILWIALPESNTVNSNLERRLYRNPDDKMIGGVASGISSYFGIETWIPRIIFAAPFIFSILSGISNIAFHNLFDGSGIFRLSIGGTTTVIYFILWWLIPEAKSTQEKMAMKGEKMDLNSIKNNVQDGIKNFGTKAQEFGDQVTQKANQWSTSINQQSAGIGKKTNTMVRSTGQKIGSGIGLIIKGFALFIGGIIAFSLLMALFGVLIGAGTAWPLKDFILEGSWQNIYAWGTIMFLAIPGIAFLIWLIRRIFKLKSNIKPVKIILGSLFFVGLFCAMFLAGNLVRSFQNSNDTVPATEVTMTQPTDKLIVKVSQPEIVYSGELPWVEFDHNDKGFDITNDTIKYSNIKVRIEASPDSAYHTKLKPYSRGSSSKDAEARAQKIRFDYLQTNNTLDLGSHISISKNEKFRGQQMLVIIQVPEGKKIRFDGSIDKLKHFDIRVSESWENGRRKWRKRERVYNDYENSFDYLTNEDYIMNEDGKLELLNKAREKATPKNENNTDAEIESKKREIKELEKQKKLDSLEKVKEKIEQEKQKIEEGQTTLNLPAMDEAFTLKTPISFACIHFLI